MFYVTTMRTAIVVAQFYFWVKELYLRCYSYFLFLYPSFFSSRMLQQRIKQFISPFVSPTWYWLDVLRTCISENGSFVFRYVWHEAASFSIFWAESYISLQKTGISGCFPIWAITLWKVSKVAQLSGATQIGT